MPAATDPVKEKNPVIGYVTHGCGWEHAEVKRSKTGSMYVKCDCCNSIDWRRSKKAEAFELAKMRPVAAEEKADILSSIEVKPETPAKEPEIMAAKPPAKKKPPVKKAEEPQPEKKNPAEQQPGESFADWMERKAGE
jgi:hypothetical protein